MIVPIKFLNASEGNDMTGMWSICASHVCRGKKRKDELITCKIILYKDRSITLRI